MKQVWFIMYLVQIFSGYVCLWTSDLISLKLFFPSIAKAGIKRKRNGKGGRKSSPTHELTKPQQR